ncbi:hypothetical protein L593_07625 [Salinarchaeum sp. Harcht-Bsk1]|uniref:hypothetical protein n=1 Tax=Salinarchaeum sp. Harcht-Bsk1 TaxID=1333523 RepID=UPI0003423194|nr:hypothetical protein [Salinarchaeum sp. Harcht-Bsk1]AGN01470.1 hypothetical protein L593_07625 [Salinarchaeum sp. Harcht-Bsk1]
MALPEHQHEAGFTAVFESLDSTPGVEIIDPIERRRRSLHTPSQVSPEPLDPGAFPIPVETAVAVETASVTTPTAEQVIVRDADGQMLAEVDHGETASFSADAYVLEPTGILRTYLRVEGPVSIAPDGHGTAIDFGSPARVGIGCRSAHERPAATVTTTSDPEDVLAAISTFGSALKTTSPERAFGSFRGHPPAVEVGSELSIPEGLEPPADDLRIEVPPEYRYAFPVAPLAYYLGAPVEPGPEPRLLGDGLDHRLEHAGSFEDGVERTLERIFLLECVTRTEGLYRVDLHERDLLEERLDARGIELPFADLYDAPQAERIAAFLDVPHDLIADLLPDWRNAAQLAPSADGVETLPYLVDDLAVLSVGEPERVSAAVVESGGVQGLLRGGDGGEPTAPALETAGAALADAAVAHDERVRDEGAHDGEARDEGAFVRGSAAADTTFVNPTGLDALERTWVGGGTPIGATKAVPEAYENRIGRTPTTGDVDIAVVCNADEMAAEGDLVDEVYGSRANLPFDVTVHRDLTTDELADVLAEEREFLHYVGHIRADGFECADGLLDVATLDSVGTDAFFLNACQSYDQGMGLVEQGAIGGIVTIRDVVNHGAVRIGRAVAKLLNYGFPLRPALELAREESVVGALYIALGDGSLSIVQTAGGTPMLIDVERRGDEYAVTLDMYGAETGIGGLTIPHVEGIDEYYLASGRSKEIRLDGESLKAFLALDDGPVRFDGQLTWRDEIDLDAG